MTRMFRESAPPALTATRPQSPKPGQGALMSTARFPLSRSGRRLVIGVAALLLGYLALVTPGADGTRTVTLSATGRYVRMDGLTRTTQYGYSIWEFQVFGGSAAAACSTGNSAQGHPATASSTENAGTPASSATDGNDGTRW